MNALSIDWSLSLPFLFSVVAMIYTAWATRRQGVDEKFRAGSKRMDEIDNRVGRVEQSIEGMPAKDDLHQLQLAMADMAGEMKAMAASQRSTNDLLRRLETVVTRHEEHLLDAK